MWHGLDPPQTAVHTKQFLAKTPGSPRQKVTHPAQQIVSITVFRDGPFRHATARMRSHEGGAEELARLPFDCYERKSVGWLGWFSGNIALVYRGKTDVGQQIVN